MYDLPYHKENNPERIHAFIGEHPFALLTGCSADGLPVATQVPLFLESSGGKQFLRGHIMKHTDHHKAFLTNENVLAVFSGPHTYVSGTWYSKPGIASTWNYMSVHIKGVIRFLDEAALVDILRKTTLHYENYDRGSSTVYDNLPVDWKKKVMPAIVAFEVEVTGIDTVFKLSQDRDFESYNNIMAELNKQGENGRAIAAEMAKRMKEVFPNGN